MTKLKGRQDKKVIKNFDLALFDKDLSFSIAFPHINTKEKEQTIPTAQ